MNVKPFPAFTVLAAALAAAFAAPAAAQSNAELLQELRALRERVKQLEQRLQQQQAQQQPPAAGQWGMTPEQARELNRIAIKTEALQDNFADQGFKGLRISGQIDPTWVYNQRQRNASFVLLNNEDARYSYDNSYFGMAVIDFEKETDSGAKWRLTLAPERGVGNLIGGSGSGIVHEATVSIPLTDLQTRLWLGQIPDWTGYEYTLPKDNKLITHNLLFDYTAPTSFTGAVLDITRDKWWTRVGLANFNAARTGNSTRAPVLTYRVDYSKGEFDGFGFSGVHGKAPNFAADGTWFFDTGAVDPNTGDPILEELGFDGAGRHTTLHLLEFDAYYIRGDWSLFGQVVYGQQKGAAIFNSDGRLRDARWWGLSGLVGYKITPRLEGILRADYIENKRNGGGLLGYSVDDDLNGIGRARELLPDGTTVVKGESVGSNRYAVAFGLNYLYDESTILKLEYRFDGASQPVFGEYRAGRLLGYRKTNNLLGASVVVSF